MLSFIRDSRKFTNFVSTDLPYLSILRISKYFFIAEVNVAIGAYCVQRLEKKGLIL